MMKIGFFLGDVSLENGGVASYANRVLETLSTSGKCDGLELVVIGGQDVLPQEPSQRFPVVSLVGRRLRESFQVLTHPGSVEQRVGRAVCRRRDSVLSSIDLLHVPYQVPPTYEVPYICTMHDVQELHFPQYFSAAERENRASRYRKSLENAAHIVVSFEHVKEDIVKFFGCPNEKISVIPIPYGACTLKALEAERLPEVSARYSEFERFFLYPAQTWKHKNHSLLIEAFELASPTLNSSVNLVCTGRKNEYFEVLQKQIRESNCQSAIHFTGIVDEGELRWLYENSLGVVIPTLYEAGSFPLIEAMSLSVPVVCANTTSLPSTVGNKEFVFDPRNSDELATMMIRLALDADFRNRNVANSITRIEEMIQVDVTQNYVELWSRVVSEI